MHVETVGQRQALVVTEIPYSTNKSGIVERIADLISKKVRILLHIHRVILLLASALMMLTSFRDRLFQA